MTGQCCMDGTASRRPVRRLSKAAASIVPGAALILMPKCPMCLAAWLTVATGAGFSEASAAWIRAALVVFWVAAVVVVAAPMIRRRVFRNAHDQRPARSFSRLLTRTQ
jgi:hypothetical protein